MHIKLFKSVSVSETEQAWLAVSLSQSAKTHFVLCGSLRLHAFNFQCYSKMKFVHSHVQLHLLGYLS